VGGILQLDIN